METTLSQATDLFDQLVNLLDNAYWEASNIEHKDLIHNLQRISSIELIELNKVSGLDADMPYEAATYGLRSSKMEFRKLMEKIQEICRRTKTSTDLNNILPDVIKIIP